LLEQRLLILNEDQKLKVQTTLPLAAHESKGFPEKIIPNLSECSA
jgi:hypothetical protein